MNRNLTLAVDEKLLERTREKLRATGKTVNEEIRDHFRRIVGEDEHLDADLAFLKQSAGCGNSGGGKFNREESYEERMKWPRSMDKRTENSPPQAIAQ
jgi:hypothetical protein